MKYFVTFTEEGIFAPEYQDYAGGRIEVYSPKEQWAIEEIRFFCKRDKFWPWREEWDFKDVTKKQLDALREEAEKEYNEKISYGVFINPKALKMLKKSPSSSGRK